MKRICVALLLFAAMAAAHAEWQPREGRELIGRPAPEFRDLRWLTSPPLTMQALRGKVVLVRFWLHGCSLCSSSATVLNDLHRRYASQGLRVVGIHHPKSRRAREVDFVRDGMRQLGFKFPIAMDNEWRTINRWWLGGADRSYTSATILVDRRGTIRWVHDGGAIPDGSAQHASLDRTVVTLLAED